MEVKRYSKELEKEWEGFVGSSVNGTFMQERKFLGYHPSDRFSDHSLIFMDDKIILAVLPAAVVQQEDKRILVSHPGASHGGLIIKSSLSTKKCLELVSALVECCAMNGFDYIRLKPVPKVYHRELSGQLDFALRFSGFRLEYTELATVLELKKDEEAFVKLVMSDTAFRNYQKALKSGLSVVEDANINDFWPILEHKLKHNHNAKPAHTFDEIKHLKTLYPDRIKLFAAYEGATPAAGVLAFLLNERVINCFYIAHDDGFQHLRPLNLIFGHMMEWGLKNSFLYLDFGISTEAKGSIVNTGLFRFKEGYGGHGILRECYLYEVNNSK
ncbi:GNAT family N-acetyltransferase [Clostridium sp. YIM B02515]|uniref:GNAT family N-acetyltransferase n=1 Tax=Clostridium rhizosphaerae TaxID=2803861 RepID=A0ABS1T7B9_9CLOT|nr:GNAT family N-acetyltransferase [Clostridium rhizosphaerae]MBL4935022.1 GNAT family N-acetyltransferase [Clostridium rhizosphaerae]